MTKGLPVPRENTLERITAPLRKDGTSDGRVRLLIYTSSTDLTVRDFSAYLTLLDSAYGRTHPDGYLSYAHSTSDHLQITSTRSGSLLLEIVKEVATSAGLWGTVLAYLVVRSGPKLIVGEEPVRVTS